MKAITATQTVIEKPILFSGPMINAILEGRKSQTRRVINPQPIIDDSLLEGGTSSEYGVHVGERRRNHLIWTGKRGCHTTFGQGLKWMAERSPYGGVSDRLWVRETFGYADESDGKQVVYRADSGPVHEATTKWKPSIFMPRWASRLTLEIVSVRVERLKDISEEDAIAEAIEGRWHPKDPKCWTWKDYGRSVRFNEDIFHYGSAVTPISTFESLWNSINGKKHPWNSNPFVWAITFRRL